MLSTYSHSSQTLLVNTHVCVVMYMILWLSCVAQGRSDRQKFCIFSLSYDLLHAQTMKCGRGSGKRRCDFRHFWKEMESLWLSISILLKGSRPYSCILRQSKQCKEVHEQQQIISFGSCGKSNSQVFQKHRFLLKLEYMVSPNGSTNC